jgi:lipopolysaccharide transport system ATP-binding protein
VAEDVIISAKALAKSYMISHEANRGPYRTLSETIPRLVNGARHAIRTGLKSRDVKARSQEEFWALRDVSFSVRRGDVVGLIGRNGAGKSTLLKILSRITEPTKGRVVIDGRVASLLEVGTGFHPELTGRENIFLNGAILGMQRAEIRRKFDEIVDFAEVERFLDTPVKRYSSGMYVRLAFAVAAHLEPEILVVDEVLAVGDTEFQKKCLGKMSEISGGGRTVLFVSHNLAAIETLCTRAIYLANGRVIQEGTTSDVVATYLGNRDVRLKRGAAKAGPKLELTEIGITPPEVRTGEPVIFELAFSASGRGQIRECAVLIYSLKGQRVALIDLREFRYVPVRYSEGRFSFKIRVPQLVLSEGDYTVGAYVLTDDFEGNISEMAELRVGAKRFQQDFAPYAASARGFVSLEAEAVVSGQQRQFANTTVDEN